MIFSVFTTAITVTAADKAGPLLDANAFKLKFEEALKVNDQNRMAEIVRAGEPVIYKVVNSYVFDVLIDTLTGKDGGLALDKAERLAEIYLEVFKSEGLLKLVKKYKTYNREQWRQKYEGDIMIREGTDYFDKGQWIAARNRYLEALEIFKRLGDSAGEARSRDNIGIIYERLGQVTMAREYYKQAIEIYRGIGDVAGEAYSLVNIGSVYERFGNYSRALEHYNKSLEISRKIEYAAGEARSLINIGNVYYILGRYTEALEYHKKSLEISREIGDVIGEADSLGNFGIVYKQLGQYTKALEYYKKSLEIFLKIKYVADEAKLLNNIGSIYLSLGRYAEALEHYNKSLVIRRKIKDVTGKANSLHNIGLVYFRLGQYNRTLEYYKESLEIFQTVESLVSEANVLNSIGMVYDILGQFTEALEYYKESFEILRIIKDVAVEAGVLNNIGVVYIGLGQYTEALKYSNKALDIYRRIGNAAGKAESLGNIGIAYIRVGEHKDALDPIKESIRLSEENGVLESVWRGRRLLGEALWKSGRGKEAVSSYKKAIDVIEEIYRNTSGFKEEERSSMIGKKSFVYRELIELLLELHRKFPDKGFDKEAFVISEKSKSRVFQELMAKAGARSVFSGDEVFQKMIEKEKQFIEKTTNLRQDLVKEMSRPEKKRNDEVVKSIKEQLSKAEQSLREHRKKIDDKYPRYADLKRPKPLKVEDLQSILKSDETLLSYAVVKEKTVAFVIGKKRFKLIELDIGREELTRLIKRFRKGLDNISEDTWLEDLRQFKPRSAYALYQKIFLPVIPELQRRVKLFLSADDLLYTLPFEALVDMEFDGKLFRKRGRSSDLKEYSTLHYLIESYTITYIPSASVLRSLRKYGKPGYGNWSKPLVAFADPVFSAEESKTGIGGNGIKQNGINEETSLTVRLLTRSTGRIELKRLKESSLEAKAISGIVNGKDEDIYLRGKATEENIHISGLHKARYLLFSTHGLLGGDFSGVAEPALALTLVNNPPGKDGFLTMSEVLGLDLNAELTVLSACNTYGRGEKAGRGEGFVGLTRSFMYAGSKSLLVTHWSVESQAARDLMIETFRNMKRITGPEALREAKLKMKDSFRKLEEDFKLSLSHPFFWAPFVLVGEGSK